MNECGGVTSLMPSLHSVEVSSFARKPPRTTASEADGRQRMNSFRYQRRLQYLSCTLLLVLVHPGVVLGFTTTARRTTVIRRNLSVEDVNTMLSSTENLSSSAATTLHVHVLPTQLVSTDITSATSMMNYQVYKNLADEFHMSLPPGNLSPDKARAFFQAQQQAMGDGRWSVSDAPPLDPHHLVPMGTLPGVAGHNMGGWLLGSHTPPLATMPSPDQMASSAAGWSADMIRVVDTLPLVVLAYCLVEFFILRPGIDRTAAEITADPVRAATDTAAVTIVRLGLMGLTTAVLLLFLYGAE